MKRCGLLGEKLGHSYSPAIHAELADYDYRLYEVAPEKLGEFLKDGEFDGLNVTIPYKKAVIPYCAALSPIAQKLQSVNVLVRRADGTLYGDNADAYGFAGMVRASGIQIDGKKTLVLGSGGAASTVCAVLEEMGARSVTIISRKGEVSTLDTPHVEVNDTVGAGDSFSGTFTARILLGDTLAEAHRKAVNTAAYVCTQAGAWPQYPAEMPDYLAEIGK